jgi:hypothetical protein
MNGSLLLTPEAPYSSFADVDSLKKTLIELQLVQPSQTDTFLCGDRFPQLITFMGCSPHLLFEPPEDGSDGYCHIILHHFTEIQLFTGQQTAPPRCPACRYRIADWKTQIDEWHKHPQNSWTCPKCQSAHNPAILDWRNSGGAGRIFIEIKNIFPGEAVPVDNLLIRLQQLSLEKWRYFYLV